MSVLEQIADHLRAAIALVPGIDDVLCRSDVENMCNTALWAVEIAQEAGRT